MGSSHRENVVAITRSLFQAHGYFVNEIILNASEFSVAQTRSRHFMVASRKSFPEVHSIAAQLRSDPLTFDEVNLGFPQLSYSLPILETNGNLSEENVDRINFLHDNGLFDLPNAQRPECHQEDHTYPSVYGRMYGNQPALTLTTGFSSPGRGRFIHPHERRTITIREAGRLQCFPDWYWEKAIPMNLNRKNFAKIIGDAVPPLMIEPVVLSLFDSLRK